MLSLVLIGANSVYRHVVGHFLDLPCLTVVSGKLKPPCLEVS